MLGVTIGVGEYYGRLAKYAAAAVEEQAGIKTLILSDEHFASSHLRFPHHLKFRLFDFVEEESLLFFDADMVCLSPWKPESLSRTDSLMAVAESARPLHVSTAQDWGVPIGEYFNAGLMILNRKYHQNWLQETERFVSTDATFKKRDPAEMLYDQAALNITRYRLGVRLNLLDRRYNWIGYGGSRLSYEMPVYMAHGLKPENKFANIDFFEGRYKPPFNPQIDIDEDGINSLKNRSFSMKVRDSEKKFRLNYDGTIGPPYFPGAGQYWFVHKRDGLSKLAVCSEAQILQEFERTPQGFWQSVQRLGPRVGEKSAKGVV